MADEKAAIRISFTKEKETKNTIRYQEMPEEGSPPIIGTLYIQKWFLGTSSPKELALTLEA